MQNSTKFALLWDRVCIKQTEIFYQGEFFPQCFCLEERELFPVVPAVTW